jgi:hypothetical protein
MYERLKDFPALDRYPSRIPAPVWNIWRRYRLHEGRETCFGLEGLPPMSVILADDEWVIVDTYLYDLPILAWSEFGDAGRESLHEPIPCVVRHFHQGASMVRNKALGLLAEELEARLRGQP